MQEQDNSLITGNIADFRNAAEEGHLSLSPEKVSLSNEAKGILVLDGLSWPGERCNIESIIHYNRDEELIEVDPDGLMRLIMIVNSGQKDRNIKLVPRNHWWRRQPAIVGAETILTNVLPETPPPEVRHERIYK